MHSEYKMTVKGFMGWPMAQKIAQPTKARNKYAPWSRKKVVSDLESTLIVSLIVSGSTLFCILLSGVNSLPTSHPIVTIPDTQLASVWSRSGDFGRVVASLDRKRLGQAVLWKARNIPEAFSIRRLGGSRWRLRRAR